MKIGDLVKFVGSWSPSISAINPKTGVVAQIWFDGRTQRMQSADILWDDGKIRQISVAALKAV